MNFQRINLKNYIKLKLKSHAWRFVPPPQPEKWVFIVGCYNSGTTLLHKILSQHPEIGSMPNEGQFFSGVLPSGRDHGLPRLWALQPELFHLKETSGNFDVDKLKRQWAWMYNDAARPVLLEKTILHAARTRWLQQHFGNSYFIGLFRDGYAVAEGIMRKEKHSLEKSIDQWRISNEILLDDFQYIKNKISVRYEELATDPQRIANSITDYLGISGMPDSVFSKTYRIHKDEGKIANMNDRSISRLNKDQIKLINSRAASMFSRLGYDLRS